MIETRVWVVSFHVATDMNEGSNLSNHTRELIFFFTSTTTSLQPQQYFVINITDDNNRNTHEVFSKKPGWLVINSTIIAIWHARAVKKYPNSKKLEKGKRIGNKYEECTLCDFFTRCDYKASNSTLNPKKAKRKGKKKNSHPSHQAAYVQMGNAHPNWRNTRMIR